MSSTFNAPLQIQNADDVLITPLEKFRKEQIGAAKVSVNSLFIKLALASLSAPSLNMCTVEESRAVQRKSK